MALEKAETAQERAEFRLEPLKGSTPIEASLSAEGLAAAAAALRVRILDLEPGALQAVFEPQRRAL